MAGIGFELRKLTSYGSFLNLMGANIYAGILSSGSWVISISFLIGIYCFLNYRLGHTDFSIQFLVAVTYLVSFSLILSAVFQHSVNRFIADKIFERKLYLICPALLSASLVLIIGGSLFGIIAITVFLNDQPLIIKLLMFSNFIVLNLVWLFSNSLTGLKNYKFILSAFFICYLLIFLLALCLFSYHLAGLLIAFNVGHVLLLTAFFVFTLKNYPIKKLFGKTLWYFMKKHQALIYSAVFFQLAVWIDKFYFWIGKNTSIDILSALRSSPIYDMPMFIAFIFMIPGVSIFFYEIEVNFSRYYHHYYDAIREGATLHEIHKKHLELIFLARNSFYNILKIQLVVATFACLFAPEILNALGLAPIFVYLLRIDLVSTSLLVFLIGQVNILYYLDRPREAFYVSAFFFILNCTLTPLTLYLGPLYFGYGFAIALLAANAFAGLFMIRDFKKLTFYAFMRKY